jgi:hypothetical protein
VCQGQYIVVVPRRFCGQGPSCIVTRIIVESQLWYTCLCDPPLRCTEPAPLMQVNYELTAPLRCTEICFVLPFFSPVR